MQSLEKLGAFYLGRRYDREARKATPELLLYDAMDLTTHAVCVGMTGSGKTGLCVALLEEAAIDAIPALIIDPKGDLANLLLTFPELRPADFRPWIDPDEAQRKGITVDRHAEQTARAWSEGLAAWGQDGARITRLRQAAEAVVYTPGGSAGLPLTVLRSFAAPPPALRADADALRERIGAASSGLLALLGIDADPVRSREQILLANLLQTAWRAGEGLDLAVLIRQIQSPPFERIGVLDLESFFPADDRADLAMRINALLASPGFAGWLEGEPLDIARLLWTPEGRPRLSVLSIAHLAEAERMFFVTIFLNEVIAWMRTQPGTASLRALLYMDEVFGYFPPTANPPCKTPMLTLLKQARAYGLGVVLATQNPVDLDYKGLSNAGTWFLGRLQTERDKARVLDGLEGASATAGAAFDRRRIEATLAGLDSRVFLMSNVHDDEPVLFQTRWTLSYLRGPMTREQIRMLMAPRKRTAAEQAASPATEEMPAAAPFPATPRVAASVAVRPAPAAGRPILPPGIAESFVPWRGSSGGASQLVYRPGLLGTARVHYVSARSGIDLWETVHLLAPLVDASADDPWEAAEHLPDGEPDMQQDPDPAGRLAPLPAAASRPASYAAWKKRLADHLYRDRTLDLLSCPDLKTFSRPGESEGAFRIRLTQEAHERRDRQLEALRRRYSPQIARLRERLRSAEERTGREQSQFRQQKMQTAISLGATVLGALFGRKLTSVGNVGRAATTARGIGRSAREQADVGRARDKEESLRAGITSLEGQLREEMAQLQEAADPANLTFDPVQLRPRKADIDVSRTALLWTPWQVGPDGIVRAAFRQSASLRTP